MMLLIIIIHVISCFLLIAIVLIQQGRGGGLVEIFSGVESMFGPKTNTFLTRATAVLSVMFFITCLSLAFLSSRQSRSLMKNIKTTPAKAVMPVQNTSQEQKPAQPVSNQAAPVLPAQENPVKETPNKETPAQKPAATQVPPNK
jgi:preprotein translocase subunit SecG